MIKLFVSDIDGTLLETGKKISERNINAVQKMVDAGITVTIATGRMYRAALPIAKELGVNVPIITYNGALIKSVSGEILHSEYLPADLISEIVKFFEKHNWYLQSYSNDELFCAFRNNYTDFYEKTQKVQATEVGWQNLSQTNKNVSKLLGISANIAENLEREKLVRAEFGERIAVTKSHPQFVDMMMPNVSKAAAVKILAEKLGVDRSEVMAIGDSDNDFPMLQAAGQSVAMGNASDEIKSACTFVTSNCEDDGFADAVEKFVFG